MPGTPLDGQLVSSVSSRADVIPSVFPSASVDSASCAVVSLVGIPRSDCSGSCGIRVYSMTMSGTCATHVLTKAKPKAVWSRRLRCMQVSRCWWSVNCCVQACKQTQRDTQGTKRAKCAHAGDTNNTPPHAIRESGVIQTSNRARVWQIWEAREDT